MSNARYRGMHDNTGKSITDEHHIAQSIRNILLTPIGSRVMRRNYGSQLFELIDQPLESSVTRLRIMSAIYNALYLWEPRLLLSHITLDSPTAGQLIATIQGKRIDTQQPFNADITLRGQE
ncbi:GPW/gp25 family protein [Serratia microhaemolytica]|uniref:GPW/gp25 family protein n=1 Tax=Serratia microhaemolytica TaxID=2675110 RepID=UPI000FDEF102|nr:GPW/gp25 family protein [Serratia microhaemolytica]